MMNAYLSFGGGVNSTAMMLLLIDQGEPFEAVFANHHGDYPETYQYVEYLQQQGFPITVLDTGDLWQYYFEHKIIPTRAFRHCTDKFKIQPIRKYVQKPCVMYLGIDAGEEHRAKPSNYPDTENRFPLVEANMDRQGCVDFIKAHGLEVPSKSGCFFCPFQSAADYRLLRDERPELYCKARRLEANCKRKDLYLCGEHPLDVIVNEPMGRDLFGYRKPCQCGL